MYRLGVDLGGSNFVVGVVDSVCKIVSSTKCKTNAPRSAKSIADDIAKTAQEAVEKAGLSFRDIATVGIGSPGLINPVTGMISFANNLGFKNEPLAAMLKERLGVVCYLENDANAAAYGEYIAGCGKGTKNLVAVTLGTGIGGGIIIDGNIYSGSNFAAAELGHFALTMGGNRCSCGKRGCFETYASASALIKQTKKAMLSNPDSLMWEIVENGIDSVDGRTAFLAEARGDKSAKRVVDQYVKYLSKGISSIIAVFQPDVIALGGGISHEGDNLLLRVKKIIDNEHFLSFIDKKTEIKIAALGNDAGVIGAALIPNLHN